MIKVRCHPDPVAKQGAKIKWRGWIDSKYSYFFSFFQKYINNAVYQRTLAGSWWPRNTNNRAAFIKFKAFKQHPTAIKIIFNNS